MMNGIGPRTPWALLVVLIVALGVYLLTGDVQASLVALVGGCAAVIVAAGGGEQPETTVIDEPDAGAGEPALQDTLDAIVEPVLIVGEGRVTIANRAACALLAVTLWARMSASRSVIRPRPRACPPTTPSYPTGRSIWSDLEHWTSAGRCGSRARAMVTGSFI